MSRQTNVYDDFCLAQFDAMTEAISPWPNANQYVSKLSRLRKNLLEKVRQAFEPEPNHFNTLIHGDLYVQSYKAQIHQHSVIFVF